METEIKTKADLHRAYADALELCEKHGLSIGHAARFDDEYTPAYPRLDLNPNGYTFPVAVVEAKPVFVGDKIYSDCNGLWGQVKYDM